MILCIGCLMMALCISSCGQTYRYIPAGEFYVKTSPADGDAGVMEVIDLEAEKKSYYGEGDITVPVTVGFGHQPNFTAICGEDVNDTFYVLYQVFEQTAERNPRPAWENKAEHSDNFYDAKYNSTIPVNRSFLFIPFYGEFYPLYKETAEIVFPEGVQNGTICVNCYVVLEKNAEHRIDVGLEISFTHMDGVLTLDG